MAEIAELVEVGRGALLGFFLQGREMLNEDVTFLNLKQFGDSVLEERAMSRKAKRKAG
ncbi:MAG: hypothetical protein F6K19_20955 [Cyanothece sp. SIO1E1]|nr:hypothetical protein [Cyanothece sp. SIO1E1]